VDERIGDVASSLRPLIEERDVRCDEVYFASFMRRDHDCHLACLIEQGFHEFVPH